MIALLFESSLPDAMCNGMLIDQSVEPEANVLNLSNDLCLLASRMKQYLESISNIKKFDLTDLKHGLTFQLCLVQRVHAIGKTIHDAKCRLTGRECGPNMPISYQKSYKKQEHGEIVDFKCRLPGHKCGPDMKYVTIQFYRNKLRQFLEPVRGKICIVRCAYINSNRTSSLAQTMVEPRVDIPYVSSSIIRYFRMNLPVLTTKIQKEFRTVDEKIEDYNCELSGKSCGKNMKFVTISRKTIGNFASIFTGSYQQRNCIQQCVCVSTQYSKKDGKCI
ncbi:unnamed protein product [Dracunculus medinensis]|uniref:ZP domain-containing protein n=1 Tax=Dracunculus medinensis TaxID=318479 RepID=A0A0N4UHX4_DRAME|nr:unnamed protein product [Dracunculus medinensis]